MNKRKKKKFQNKMKVVMYCRVGTPEQLLPDDRKKETLIVQKNKKALISYLILSLILILQTICDIIIHIIME